MEDDQHHGPEISPLFIGLVGILAGAIIVATMHCITVSWCRLRQSPNTTPQHQPPRVHYQVETPSSTSTSTSTSNSSASLVPVYRYSSKEDRESTCAVCLSEFKEGEEVRVLPECAHQFHVMCVDMWLFSHSNCPLCRAHTTALQPPHVVVLVADSGGVPPPELPRIPDVVVDEPTSAGSFVLANHQTFML